MRNAYLTHFGLREPPFSKELPDPEEPDVRPQVRFRERSPRDPGGPYSTAIAEPTRIRINQPAR